MFVGFLPFPFSPLPNDDETQITLDTESWQPFSILALLGALLVAF
jgi:hypothetical protein